MNQIKERHLNATYFVDFVYHEDTNSVWLPHFYKLLKCCFHLQCSGPPPSNAWLDYQNGTLVAVCNVSSVKTAANISWNHEGATRNTQAELDGIFIVESRLELRKETDAENLKCTIRHPDWPEEWIIKPTFRKSKKLSKSWHELF